jgi:hypothetical protein
VIEERLRTFTPLGIRFLDAVTEAGIDRGLTVTAQSLDGATPQTPAFRTRSGVYAFHGLPGLRRLERFDRVGAVREALPPPTPFVVRVRDRLSRFNPTVALVGAPTWGLAPMLMDESPPGGVPADSSPPGAVPAGIYLFPAPSRRVRSDVAVVRASLARHAGGEPAAHARLDVVVAGTRWAGVADELGNVAVMFPYPIFSGAGPASPPPGSQGIPPEQQSWALTVQVRYDPEALDYPPGSEVPTLGSILIQSPTDTWPHAAGQPVGEMDAVLTFGHELIMRTEGSNDSTLMVGAASP